MTDNLVTKALRQVLALPGANVLSVSSTLDGEGEAGVAFKVQGKTYYTTYSEGEVSISVEDEGFSVIVKEPKASSTHLVEALNQLALHLERRVGRLTALVDPTKAAAKAGAQVFGLKASA